MSKINTAIFPVAGFGTRFLPATKAQPKEMLTVVDKPQIQYLVEEAANSGIRDIIFITGRGKRAIEDHFDESFELESALVEKGNKKALEEVKKVSRLAKFAYVRQPRPLGHGDAILRAEHLVGRNPFAVIFGDDLIDSKVPALKQMFPTFEKYGDPVVALKRVPHNMTHLYGIVSAKKVGDHAWQITDIIEKPKPSEAPSNLAIVGKYILTPEIFDVLRKHKKSGKELDIGDGLKYFLKKGVIYGHELDGDWYDCGSKVGFLRANIAFALKHPELKKEFRKILREYI